MVSFFFLNPLQFLRFFVLLPNLHNANGKRKIPLLSLQKLHYFWVLLFNDFRATPKQIKTFLYGSRATFIKNGSPLHAKKCNNMVSFKQRQPLFSMESNLPIISFTRNCLVLLRDSSHFKV